jgi:acetylornithine/succinyldiaminopimelate/putrescine aminotransferase
VVAHKVLEICARKATQKNGRAVAEQLRAGLDCVQAAHADFFVGIRQRGLIMGLEFAHPEGAKYVMRSCYENGIWAIYSALDPRALQFKPGLLLERELCDEILERLDKAVGEARAAALGKVKKPRATSKPKRAVARAG